MEYAMIEGKHSIRAGFIWLSLAQGANFLVPVIIYPFLLRIITIEQFGLVIFAQAVALYLNNVVDYGLTISSARDISLKGKTKQQLSSVINKTISLRAFFFLICAGLLGLFALLIPYGYEHRFLFIYTVAIVAGQVVNPFYLFQGMEKMEGIAVTNFISKIIFAGLIIFLITGAQDYIYVNLFLGVSQIIVGLAAFIYILFRYNISFKVVSLQEIRMGIKKNKPLFLSQLSQYTSGNSNMILIGFLADPISVGIYAIVDKILIAFKAPAVLLYQAVYPKVCKLTKESSESMTLFFKKLFRFILITFIPLGILICIFSDQIVYLFSGEYMPTASQLLLIISAVPLLAALNIPFSQTLLAFDFRQSYMKATLISSVIGIISGVILIKIFGAYGAAFSTLLIEALTIAACYLFLSTRHSQYATFRLINTGKI